VRYSVNILIISFLAFLGLNCGLGTFCRAACDSDAFAMIPSTTAVPPQVNKFKEIWQRVKSLLEEISQGTINRVQTIGGRYYILLLEDPGFISNIGDSRATNYLHTAVELSMAFSPGGRWLKELGVPENLKVINGNVYLDVNDLDFILDKITGRQSTIEPSKSQSRVEETTPEKIQAPQETTESGVEREPYESSSSGNNQDAQRIQSPPEQYSNAGTDRHLHQNSTSRSTSEFALGTTSPRVTKTGKRDDSSTVLLYWLAGILVLGTLGLLITTVIFIKKRYSYGGAHGIANSVSIPTGSSVEFKPAQIEIVSGSVISYRKPSPGDRALPFALQIVAGEDQLRALRLYLPAGRDHATYTFGRRRIDTPTHFQLNHGTVSYDQAKIIYSAGQLSLVNLSTTNPTTVNEIELYAGENRFLASSDKIQMGSLVFILSSSS
jgi:hypothetical protein